METGEHHTCHFDIAILTQRRKQLVTFVIQNKILFPLYTKNFVCIKRPKYYLFILKFMSK